jgi:hypothetical protein
MIAARLVAAVLGAALVVTVALGAIRIFVVPRGVRSPLAFALFRLVGRMLRTLARVRGAREHHERDRIMVFWAPLSVLALPAIWLVGALLGYAAIFWAIDPDGFGQALTESGSSLFTLGFSRPPGVGSALVAFSEAAVGIALLALVISYLPTLNAAFGRRELVVAMLDSRAGTPPDPIVLYQRQLRYAGLESLDESWPEWERWIVDVGESHYTHAMLAFFRSSNPGHSWTGAVGTLLDAANLRLAAIDAPGAGNAAAWLFMQAGLVAVTRIADYFGLEPVPGGPTAVDRAGFDAALDELDRYGAPLLADRGAAWEWFDGRRSVYLPLLNALCLLVDAPRARPWGTSVARGPVTAEA